MITKIEKEKGNKDADNVISQLKEGMESSSHLAAFIDRIRNKFPITPTKKKIMWVCHGLSLLCALGFFLADVGTDSWVTHKYFKFSMANTSLEVNSPLVIYQLGEAIEHSTNSCGNSTNGREFLGCVNGKNEEIYQNLTEHDDQKQFKRNDWFSLFIICTVHLILPWLLFFCVSIYLEISLCKSEKETSEKEKSGKHSIFFWATFDIILFPVSIFFKKFSLETKLTTEMAKEETDHIKKKKDVIKKELEYTEKKEILMSTIEVTSESSFQFFIQMMLALPQILFGFIAASQSKTVSSFGEKIVSPETLSILMSFFSMGRSFYRIRNRNKKNALKFNSAVIILLLTTLETMSRILSVGMFLYLYSENLNPIMALGIYYVHVGIMLAFNIMFNKERPKFSFAYVIGLIFNSLSSTYSYNYYNYAKPLDKNLPRKADPSNKICFARKEEEKDVQKLHQPSLIRQMCFYIIFLIETASLACLSVFFFEDKARDGNAEMSNGLGGHFTITRGNLYTVIGITWGSQFLAIILRLVYYGMHPSSVSMTDIKAKFQIYILGQVVLSWKSFCDIWTLKNKKTSNNDEESGTVKTKEGLTVCDKMRSPDIASIVEENVSDVISEKMDNMEPEGPCGRIFEKFEDKDEPA